MASKYIIGVDIGGTKIASALADEKGNIIAKNVTPTQSKKGGSVVSSKIILCITHLLKDTGIKVKQLKNIVLGVPGQIDLKTKIILNAPNINGWKNFDIISPLQKEFNDVPIILENDANCAAMGEVFFGAGKEFKNAIFITVSTGIGGGIIINNKLYTGKDGMAGEIGHMALNIASDEDNKCGCGRLGCFEAYASGTSMAKRAQKKIKEMEILKDNYGHVTLELACGNHNKITSVILSQAAKMKDEFAIDIIKENAYYIGLGCTNLINLLDPEAIIIGGGVSKIGKLLFDTIKSTVKEHVKMTNKLKTKIIPATTGTDAGILGTIAIGMSQ